jgi:hypothetical protein
VTSEFNVPLERNDRRTKKEYSRKTNPFSIYCLTEENKMNQKQFFTYGIMLMLVMLLTACAALKTTPCPTTATLSCPTTAALSCPTTAPQSCPTAAAQAMPVLDGYRTNTIDPQANVIFTFDPGDKCTMQIRSRPFTSDFAYQIVVNDNAHLNYMVAGTTLNAGYTLADVEEWNTNNPHLVQAPPMVTLKIYGAVNPMSNTIHLVQYTGDPLLFACITEGPDAHQIIAQFDPLVMPTK